MADPQSQHQDRKRKDREDDEDINSMTAQRPKPANGVELEKGSIVTVSEGSRVTLEAAATQELFLNMIDYGAMQRKDRAKKEQEQRAAMEEIARLQAEAQYSRTAHADVNEQLINERPKHEEVQAQLDIIQAQLAKKEELLVKVQAELLETEAELSKERIFASKAGKVPDLESQFAEMEKKMLDLKNQLEKVTAERDGLLKEKKASIQQSTSSQPQVPQKSAKGWIPVFELPVLKDRQGYKGIPDLDKMDFSVAKDYIDKLRTELEDVRREREKLNKLEHYRSANANEKIVVGGMKQRLTTLMKGMDGVIKAFEHNHRLQLSK